MSATERWRVGVDIGGTFTDVVLWREGHSQLVREKLLTTPDDPAKAVLDGVARALETAGVQAAALDRVIHGTTLVANALIERKGVPTGLITTRGFRDVLEIGREWRYDLFNLDIEMPAPLVARHLRVEVDERMDASGNVLVELDQDSVESAVLALKSKGVESVGVCLLHAYRNPAHEQRVAETIGKAMPDAAISLSSAVSPELGEYERTSTTVANAYVHPIFRDYVRRLQAGLHELGYGRDLLMVLSDGRLIRADVAERYPIRLVQSGPAAGAEAARLFGSLAGAPDVLCFDMGGTTAKACLVPDGEPERTVQFEVARETRFAEGSGLPLHIPAIDMIEIGAGGGSIARVDTRGLLQVGPHSAGASPGPACYGLGNTFPTVTDCDLLLGYLDAESFLGGQMQLDIAAAEAAVREHLAQPLGITVIEAAFGVHETVTSNMAQAATIHAIERSLDVTRFAMLPIGGAGPVHACSMASKMGIHRMICPPGAGVASAIGMLASSISFEVGRAAPARLEEIDFAAVSTLVNDMDAEASNLVAGAGVDDGDVTRQMSAMMRYVGQGYEIETLVTGELLANADEAGLAAAFKTAYERRYGRSEKMPVEVLSWRLSVAGPRSSLAQSLRSQEQTTTTSPEARLSRAVWFDDAWVTTPVFDREALTPGMVLEGPAIIEEAESTLVVSPRFGLRVDLAANLILGACPRIG
ncbi:MAG: hydantoinase/oxoprolinase family protein [Chromatiales bacterium]|jgi:N-methylhydantoinase A|nr:hydantoinase/oxoprolinase family protein [Chromatiales bacterium]